MEVTYALSRNKRSSKWQFRKRYPSDISRILPGEFVKSTGEEDKRAAQSRVPMIAAEYERRVAEARAKLSEAPPVTLGKSQILAMAAQFYSEGLEAYTLNPDVNRLTIGLLAVINEDERERIAERTRAALQAAKARGVKLGNPNGAAALRRARKGNEAAVGAVKNNAERFAADLADTIKAIQATGKEALSAIAEELNAQHVKTRRGRKWHASSVRNLLARL